MKTIFHIHSLSLSWWFEPCVFSGGNFMFSTEIHCSTRFGMSEHSGMFDLRERL